MEVNNASREEVTFNSEQWYGVFEQLDPLLHNELKHNNGQYTLLQGLHDAAPSQHEFIDALSYFICENNYLEYLVETLKQQILKQTSATVFREDSLTLAIFRDVLIYKTRTWQHETCVAAKESLSSAELQVLTNSQNNDYPLLCTLVIEFLDRILQSKLPEDVEEIFRDIANYVSKTLNIPLSDASAISLSNLLILRATIPSLYYRDPSTNQHRPFVQCQKIIQSIFNNQTVSSNFPPIVHDLARKYSPLIRAWMGTQLRPWKDPTFRHVVVFEADLLPEVDYKTWDTSQVCLWLTRLDMAKFVIWAQHNEVCGSDLRHLELTDLADTTATSLEKFTLISQIRMLKGKGPLQRSDSPDRMKLKKSRKLKKADSSGGLRGSIANSRAASREFDIT